MDFLVAIVLSVIEGITEFLPISSTGHMILVEDFLRLSDDSAFADSFMVIIQLPAILSVVVYFWSELCPLRRDGIDTEKVRLWIRIVIAFLPAAAAGRPIR